MAEQKETFSASEYSAWRKVSRILAEDGGEPENNGSSESSNNDSESDDPSVAYREKQRKLYEEQERKRASITPDQLKEVDKVLDGIRW